MVAGNAGAEAGIGTSFAIGMACSAGAIIIDIVSYWYTISIW